MPKKTTLKKWVFQSVRLTSETVERLKNLSITTGGVPLSGYEEKVLHLLWSFEQNKKNGY